ncbi:MAG: hypothetical protein IT173_18675 [Acidobacteria bacterium]|nr:hypothetical protein [Acidobacteriota bacterium]
MKLKTKDALRLCRSICGEGMLHRMTDVNLNVPRHQPGPFILYVLKSKIDRIMALSSEDRTEIQLLVLQELEKLLHESSGFSEARRAAGKRRQELEADLLDHQRNHGEASGMWKDDPES